MSFLIAVLIIAGAYFLGAIPIAYLLVKSKTNIDIREVGSGNVGATNAARVLGNEWFVFLTLLDALKGAIPCLVMIIIFHTRFREVAPFARQFAVVLAGLAAIVGHTLTPYLNFRGGKGMAAAAGVFVVISPITALALITFFALVVYTTKYISLGSVLAAVILPIGLWFERGPQTPVFWVGLILAIYLIYKHRSNIARLVSGTENRFGRKHDE